MAGLLIELHSAPPSFPLGVVFLFFSFFVTFLYLRPLFLRESAL